jgi:zinc/manganese transport system permease protein
MTFSWNLISDVRDMWSFPFMINAFRAGTIVAITAAVIGWFVVLRRQTFAAHTISLAGFPGAAGALWLGLPIAFGYFGFAILAASIFALSAPRSGRGHSEEPAIIGTFQALALASGGLFLALYGGFLGGASTLLFGTFLGITPDQVVELAIVCVGALLAIGVLGRRLLFTSVDPHVARARGVPTGAVSTCFLLLLGSMVAVVSQITGALLVFALLVLPAATAQQVTRRIGASLGVAVVTALIVVWASLFAAFYSPYPIGSWLSTLSFAFYVLARATKAIAERRPAPAPSPAQP